MEKIHLKILSERQSITAARASTSADARPSTSAAASVRDAIAADENEGLEDDGRTNNGKLHSFSFAFKILNYMYFQLIYLGKSQNLLSPQIKMLPMTSILNLMMMPMVLEAMMKPMALILKMLKLMPWMYQMRRRF